MGAPDATLPSALLTETSPESFGATCGLNRSRRIPELDGARGLAIAFVLLFHYINDNVPKHTLAYYALLPTRQMWSGVDLFFVLSGFLIGGILLDHRGARNYYSTFYARRVHRIFPLYYLMVAGFIVGIYAFPHLSIFRGSIPWWTYLFFAQNLTGQYFTHAAPWIISSWSLAVEEQFYLVFPAFVRLFSRKVLIGLVAGCIVGAPLLRTILVLRGVAYEQIYAFSPCRADALALGVAAAMIMRSETAVEWIRKNAKLVYASLLLFNGVLPALLKWKGPFSLYAASLTFFDVMYFLIILLLLIAPIPQMKSFFRLRILGWLGTLSYCVYLIHQPVREGVFHLLGVSLDAPMISRSTIVATIATLAAVLLIAQISWVFLEKPLVKRAHQRYRYDGADQTAALA